MSDKKPLSRKIQDFAYWRIYRRLSRLMRLFGPRFASTTVKGRKISILVSSDIEQYRIDSYGSKEPETLEWLDSQVNADSVLFDIGANVGLYSLYAATVNREARVFAFEPEAQNFAHLCQNVHRNQLDNIVPCNIALTDKEVFDYFHISTMEPGSAMHSLHAPTEQRHGGSLSLLRQGMLAISLDDLVERFRLDQPTLVKLDVDGIELQILRGARRALQSEKLRSVLIELTGDVEKNSEAAEMHGILTTAGLKPVREGECFFTGEGEPTRNIIYERV